MRHQASSWTGRESMVNAETLSLHQQAERLQGWRDGFQAVYVIATGVQSGFFDQLAAQPQGLTTQELAQRTACHAPYVAIWCASAYRYHLVDTVNGRYVLAPHMDTLLARGFAERIHVECLPAEQMPYTEAFDGVLITRVFHEIPVAVRAVLFQACYRALKRPGVLLNLDFAYPDTLAEYREPLFWSGVDNQYREMSWGTVHPTWQEQQHMLAAAGFAAVERPFVRHIPQGTHYLAVAHKR